MSVVEVPLLLLVSFFATVTWGRWYIGVLHRYKLGKQIRVEGPASHRTKAGTPTMGGWLFIATSSVLAVVFVRDWRTVLPVVLAMLAFGLFGSVDDWANLRSREGIGLRVRYKFLWHNGIALAIALILYFVNGIQAVQVPVLGAVQIGWWFIPLATLAIFGTTSGVNEVDGLDGLAAGTAVIAFAAYAVIALALVGQSALAAISAIIIGSVLGFLWFNCHPASVFMGDAGSLALGAGLATVALLSGWVLILPVIGLVFVLDLLSVVLQVAYFKLTHGQRIFKMSPIHHHFELSGWAETQVVQRFWLAAALCAAAGLALAVA